MSRPDLLALTLDDLATLTNRGTVKRAHRELESGEVTFTLSELADGQVTVDWSDEAKCLFPAAKTVSDGRCSCVATTVCRHLVRSVLAYQKQAATGDARPAPPQSWNPGDISDEQLAQLFKKSVLAAAQARYQQGILVELVRSAKPTARFHQLACTLRFVVPHDLRYTHCDCAEAAPCSHVPLAVWAFRQLPSDQPAGIVATQQDDLAVPAELLDAGETLLREMIDSGISGLHATWSDRALRLEQACADCDLVWPAGILADLVQECARYASHDARFAPERVAELAGEWLIRSDAIRHRTRATPQLLIRGSSTDRATDIGSARYTGIGCGVQQERGGVTATAYLQDSDSGSLVAISRDFSDPGKDSKDLPKDFWRLAQTPAVRGIPLAMLGASHLLLQGGKRASDHRLIVGRAKASANPQSYAWESLRSPLLAEDFGELRARLAALPPASLRPRYIAEDLHVVPVASVVQASFNEAAQAVEILVKDSCDETARIQHPYVSRAREGTEALLAALADPARRLCFVAGQVRLSSAGLVVHPVSLVFETGGIRQGIQPWVDRRGGAPSAAIPLGPPADIHSRPAPGFPQMLLNHLGELLLQGLRRADAPVASAWAEFARDGDSLGYHRLTAQVALLGEELGRKLASPHWTPDKATHVVVYLLLLARLAQDVSAMADLPRPLGAVESAI